MWIWLILSMVLVIACIIFGIHSFLSSRNIVIGTKLEVKRRLPFDNSVEIKFKNRQSINISEQVANAIHVNPL